MKMHNIESQVASEFTNGFRVKVSILELGLYISGFTARYSDRSPSGLWIQPPSINSNGKWVKIIEFNKTMPLWKEIEDSVIEAINLYKNLSEDFEDLTKAEMDDRISETVDQYHKSSEGSSESLH